MRRAQIGGIVGRNGWMGEVLGGIGNGSDLGCEERDAKGKSWVSGFLHLVDYNTIK